MPSFLGWLQPLITQKYEGDCTIVPDLVLKDYTHILNNPTTEDIRRCMRSGEHNTWPSCVFFFFSALLSPFHACLTLSSPDLVTFCFATELTYLSTQYAVERTLGDGLRKSLRCLTPSSRSRMRNHSSWALFPSDHEFSDYDQFSPVFCSPPFFSIASSNEIADWWNSYYC